MKKILTFLILAAIPLTVCGQFNPPPAGAFTYSGSSWVAAVTSATGGALGFTPPPAALYCYNSTSGQWVPFDASCQVGGAGVYLPLSGGTMTGPLAGTTFTATTSVTTPSLTINGGTATGYHGSSGTKVQLSDGTGTSGPAYFASDGSLTTGGIANIQITVGTAAVSATCSSNTLSSAVTMPGLTTSNTLTFTASSPSDISSTAGWDSGALFFVPVLASGSFQWRLCTGNSSGTTPGASTTWNVSAQ